MTDNQPRIRGYRQFIPPRPNETRFLFTSMRECEQCGTSVLVKWSPETGAYPAPKSCAQHT